MVKGRGKMRYVYEPKGKAQEYGEHALNLYEGCVHGCTYCYVPDILRKMPKMFHALARARAFDWAVLKAEIASLRGKSLFLCFTCDPYQLIDRETGLTRQVIQLCHASEVRVVLLTKAGQDGQRDFDLLSARPDLSSYGATLTFCRNDDASLRWEPNAALPGSRGAALERAHRLGIPTWASLEPVIDPAQSLEIIHCCHEFVDVFKVGRWNHDARANAIDWRAFGREAVRLLEGYGKRYYIKKDLAAYL